MTICIATDNDITIESGTTTFNIQLMQLLRQAGHSVVLLCVDEAAAEHAPDAYIKEDKMLRVVLKSSYKKLKNYYEQYYRPGSFDAPRWIAMGLAFREWLTANAKEQQIDLVEVNDFGGAGIFLCSVGLPPVVITGHCSLLQYCRYNFCTRDAHYKTIERLEQLSFTYANTVITHSRLSNADTKTFSKAHVAQAPIPWMPAMTAVSGKEENHIAIVGSLQILKGAETVCKALEYLRQQGQILTVHWIGDDTATSPNYGSVAQYLSEKYSQVWNRSFIWQGIKKHGEVLDEMRNALFVVIPSHWETFGYVALEAASLGKAIIISEKAGASELFTNGKNAIVIPAGDETALAAAMLELCQAEDKRQMLGSTARSLVEHTFTQTKSEARLSIYKNVIQQFNGHKPDAEKELDFLRKYHTPARRFYFRLRGMAKKWLRT